MKIELIVLGSVGEETKGRPEASPVLESSINPQKTLNRTASNDFAV